ncbi:unnamed protein product [Urochloa humidicola]
MGVSGGSTKSPRSTTRRFNGRSTGSGPITRALISYMLITTGLPWNSSRILVNLVLVILWSHAAVATAGITPAWSATARQRFGVIPAASPTGTACT